MVTMEIIEGTAVEVPVSETPQGTGWLGDNQFFLVAEPADRSRGNVGIDLDQGGWVEQHKELMRQPGTWLLYHKASGRPIFCVILEEGDQFYYTVRHVGNLMAGSEVQAVGVGKKHADGRTLNMWLLPNGVICGGDDVEEIASRMLGG
jgi:hypothetical protein